MIYIKNEVITEIRCNISLRKHLEDELGIGDVRTLQRHLSQNRGNGDLTKLAALILMQAYLKKDMLDLIIIGDDQETAPFRTPLNKFMESAAPQG